MTLHGEGLANFDPEASTARCIWGAAAVETQERTMTPLSIIDDQHVTCETAAVTGFSGAAYFVAVKVSLNGIEYGVPQFVRYYEQPRLFLDLVPVVCMPHANPSASLSTPRGCPCDPEARARGVALSPRGVLESRPVRKDGRTHFWGDRNHARTRPVPRTQSRRPQRLSPQRSLRPVLT